jgi:hypothetical protein
MGFITRHGYLRSVDRPAITSVRAIPGNFEQVGRCGFHPTDAGLLRLDDPA